MPAWGAAPGKGFMSTGWFFPFPLRSLSQVSHVQTSGTNTKVRFT